ncbi:YlxR family protein [Maridesulfovibrio sp. FT414]|uniref:YlxR family protein n=1 Tax=Maridesulfovibrio sp. FT414 TaxID=2979469 RepID=UPI003D807A90
MNSSHKHVPTRSCVICRQRFAKEELLRFVIGKGASDDELIPDDKKVMQGRGYYVCGDAKCLERFKFFRPRKKKFRG